MKTSNIQQAFNDVFLNRANAEEYSEYFKGYSIEELTARLAVYKNNYYKSLQEALTDAFPTIQSLLGEEFFNATVNRYLEVNPPRSASLLLLGENFPEFLAEFEHTREITYLPDTAKFDWSRHFCYHAEDVSYMIPEEFGNIDPSILMESSVIPIPAQMLLTSEYAFYSVWELNNHPDSQNEKLEVNLRENVLVIRKDMEIEIFKLDDSIFNFLQSLEAGATIGESLEQALALDSNFDAGVTIGFLIQSGFIRSLKFGGQEV